MVEGKHEIDIIIDGKPLEICPIICNALEYQDEKEDYAIERRLSSPPTSTESKVRIHRLAQKALIEHNTQFEVELMSEDEELSARMEVDIFGGFL